MTRRNSYPFLVPFHVVECLANRVFPIISSIMAAGSGRSPSRLFCVCPKGSPPINAKLQKTSFLSICKHFSNQHKNIRAALGKDTTLIKRGERVQSASNNDVCVMIQPQARSSPLASTRLQRNTAGSFLLLSVPSFSFIFLLFFLLVHLFFLRFGPFLIPFLNRVKGRCSQTGWVTPETSYDQ